MSERVEPGEPSLRSTVTLLSRARQGDEEAIEELFERHRARLGSRMPSSLGFDPDTEDFVQETVVRMLPRLETFEPKPKDAFATYMRRGLLNLIIDHQRRANEGPSEAETASGVLDWRPTPLEEAIDAETAVRYETALTALTETDRTAIIARVELGLSYKQIVQILGDPSEDAARMTVSRAVYRLATRMRDVG